MTQLEKLREDVKIALDVALPDYVSRITIDLEYLAGCDPQELEGGETRKIGLELYLQEPRILEQLEIVDYLIHDCREEQRVYLTEKGEALYQKLREEGIYKTKLESE